MPANGPPPSPCGTWAGPSPPRSAAVAGGRGRCAIRPRAVRRADGRSLMRHAPATDAGQPRRPDGAASALRDPASRKHPRDREVPPLQRRLGRWLGLVALALALHATWMPAKAALSQLRLEATWEDNRADGGTRRPWPWADTHAVARLRQKTLGVDQVVLAGDDGRALAFGPGWAAASAAPGSGHGATIISGHRDTHFAWLRHLQPGDEVELETTAGLRRYRLASTRIA